MPCPHLILLPGLLNDAALWAHQAATLADLAEVAVPELGRDDSLAAMAERVLAAAPERFALAGMSMGGYLAQEIMRRQPQRVERLALLDTTAAADTPEQAARRRELMALAADGRFDEVPATLLPNLVHPDHARDPAIVAAFLGMAERIGAEGFVRQQTAILRRPDGWEDLRRIACPTLVLVGRQDALTPPAAAERMAATIGSPARLVIVEDCGHLSPLEQPQAVSAVLRYWLQA